jgi:hypothetical protein
MLNNFDAADSGGATLAAFRSKLVSYLGALPVLIPQLLWMSALNANRVEAIEEWFFFSVALDASCSRWSCCRRGSSAYINPRNFPYIFR